MRLVRVFALLAFVLAFTPSPAVAVTGFDSAYSGESAFVTVQPGETASFQVFFKNTGTTAWTKGTDTQVDLAACLADKVTCNAQDPADSTWNSGWLSSVRYATHTQTVVSAGSIATFAYNVKAPSNATAGTNRFNGDLVVAKTGDRIHPEGYYQDATIEATGSVASPTPAPTPGSTPMPSPPPPTATPAPPTPTPTPTPVVLRAEPGSYDPDQTNVCVSAWTTEAGSPNEVLRLAKNGVTSTNCAAGATITVNHEMFTGTLTELGYDYRTGTWCGAGAPRINVYTGADPTQPGFFANGGQYWAFGCTYGTHTASPQTGFTRVRFDPATDGTNPVTGVQGPITGAVTGVEIIFDEGTDVEGNGTPGGVTLDNIDINGILITNNAGTTIP